MLKRLIKGISKEEYVQKQKEKDALDQTCYFNESINTLKADVDKLGHRIEDIKSSLESFFAHFSGQLNDVDIKVNNIDHESRGKLGDFSLLMDGHTAGHRVLKDKCEAVCEMYFDHEENIAKLKAQINDLSKKFQCYKDLKEIERTQDLLASDKKLENKAEEIIARPVGIEELRGEIQDKLDLLTADGKNSVLRHLTSEKEIQFIRKRIEQIFLLLKKNNLDQGM